MESMNIKAETRYDDLSGAVSINFNERGDFNFFAADVAKVDVEKYQPVAMRVYLHHDAILTIYALDKQRYQAHKLQTGKLLIRKFKVDISPEELFSRIKQIDFTLVSGDYNIEDFDIIN
jgi:hypothetical protein